MKAIKISKNILTENSDILKDFFIDINKYPVYSGEEQIELAKQAKYGNDKAREQ